MKNTRKTLAAITAAAALTITATPALADTAHSAVVKGGALNLREEPSLTAKVLGQFPTGTLVNIVSEGTTWHAVEVNGKEGFMMAKFLNAAEAATTATVRTNTGAGLNLRESASIDGAIITSVKNGATLTVLQKGTNWSRVEVDGKEGFVASQYLRFNAGSSNTLTGKKAVVNNPKDTQVLNLRKEPSLNAKVIEYYYNGTEVAILKDQGAWLKVQVEDGNVGYMMKKYLKVTGDAATMKPFQAKVINVNGGSYVNFRKGASLSSGVIARIPVGMTVTVIEHGTDWCKVNVDGTTGYISTWFMQW